MPKLNHAINVTPLADVMLVLLIIFMVVTPLMDQGVAVDVPEAANPTEHPNDDGTLILALKGDGSIWLNESSLPRAEAAARVREALERRETKVLYVKASASLDYGWVLEMMDVCRRAGAEEIALITKETIDEGTPRS